VVKFSEEFRYGITTQVQVVGVVAVAVETVKSVIIQGGYIEFCQKEYLRCLQN
jgi:hypothetical protein